MDRLNDSTASAADKCPFRQGRVAIASPVQRCENHPGTPACTGRKRPERVVDHGSGTDTSRLDRRQRRYGSRAPLRILTGGALKAQHRHRAIGGSRAPGERVAPDCRTFLFGAFRTSIRCPPLAFPVDPVGRVADISNGGNQVVAVPICGVSAVCAEWAVDEVVAFPEVAGM